MFRFWYLPHHWQLMFRFCCLIWVSTHMHTSHTQTHHLHAHAHITHSHTHQTHSHAHITHSHTHHITCTFFGPTLYPSLVILLPKKLQSSDLNTDLFRLKVRLFALAVSRRVMTALSCWISSAAWLTMSSTIPVVLGTGRRTLSRRS